MKIHFTVSFRGAEQNREQMSALLKALKAEGHKITLRPFAVDDADVDERSKQIEDLIETRTGSSASDIYKLTLKRIREADVVISDSTVPSSGIGYEIAMAQNEKKPILTLHNKSAENSRAQVLSGNQDRLFEFAEYSTVDEAMSEIRSFLEDAKQKMDTKFILIISPEIDNYLNWAAEERRLHKAQIVRNAVEEIMKTDKEYQAYLKEKDL